MAMISAGVKCCASRTLSSALLLDVALHTVGDLSCLPLLIWTLSDSSPVKFRKGSLSSSPALASAYVAANSGSIPAPSAGVSAEELITRRAACGPKAFLIRASVA